eukprot:2414342-Amphidinium_carterae.1
MLPLNGNSGLEPMSSHAKRQQRQHQKPATTQSYENIIILVVQKACGIARETLLSMRTHTHI